MGTDTDQMNSVLPSKWRWVEINDLIDLIQNGTTAKQNQDGVGYPVTRIQTIQNNQIDSTLVRYITDEDVANRFRYGVGDILFSHINSFDLVGKVAIYKGDPEFLVHGMNLLRLTTNTKLCEPDYLFWYLQSPIARSLMEPFIRRAIGQASINQTNLKKVSVPIPFPDDPEHSLAEQRRIVVRIEALLGEVREMRELAMQVNDDTNKLMRSVLGEIYRDLASKFAAVETQHVCRSITDGDHTSPTYTYDGIPFLFVRHIVNGFLDFEDTKFVDKEYYDNLTDSRKPELGDVLYSVVGSYGVPVLVDTDRKFSFQRHIGILKPDHNTIDANFFRWILRAPQVLEQAHKVVTGSAQKTLTLKYLRKLSFPFPPSIDEQVQIANYLQSVYQEIIDMQEINAADTDHLDMLEQSVLAEAFKGRL